MIVIGMLVGTLFTLFVLPSIYSLMARAHSRSSELEELQQLA